MATPNDTRSTPSDALGPPGERGELIVVGQVAMATDHGGQRTKPTGDAGCPIRGRLLEAREEAPTGAWTVRPLHGAPPGVGKASEGRTDGEQMSNLTAVQSTA